MTPHQTKALEMVLKVTNDSVRTEAVMLIAANNVDGLGMLRFKCVNDQTSVKDHRRVMEAHILLRDQI
jgi:hypothetical protein